MKRVSDAESLRDRLAGLLQREGTLRDPEVERAIRTVPRHVFVPNAPLEVAYEDRVIRLKDCDGVLVSSLSQPAMIVEMLQQLEVREGDRILEIGTGSGYTTALLAALTGPNGSVVSLDLEADLVEAATVRFSSLGLSHIRAFARDGALGYEPDAPYDRILLTVCVTDIQGAWWEQLQPGGRIVLPLSFNGVQKSIAFQESEGRLESRSAIDCGFVMLRGSAQHESVQRIKENPDVYLSADSRPHIDTDGLIERLLHQDPLWERVPGDYTPRDFHAGAMLWLALHDERFCRIETGNDAPPHLPALLLPYGESRLTIGLCDRDSIALLGFRLDPPRSPALFTAQFGPMNALAMKLRETLEAWDRAGRPGKRGLDVVATRANSAPGREIAAGTVVNREHSTFALNLR